MLTAKTSTTPSSTADTTHEPQWCALLLTVYCASNASMCASKAAAACCSSSSIFVGGLYLMFGIWVHNNGMEPRTCQRETEQLASGHARNGGCCAELLARTQSQPVQIDCGLTYGIQLQQKIAWWGLTMACCEEHSHISHDAHAHT